MEMTLKARLRAEVRSLFHQFSPEQRAEISARLCSRLREQPVWLSAKSVLLFSPLADEPDVSSLIDAALESGKLVALPQFQGATGRYAAAQVQALDQLRKGRFGALEPDPQCPVVELNQLDLILVPGVAFDSFGGRLGRGKGFYDRLLAQVRGHKCGVAYDEQLVARVPVEPHDVRVDSIMTPTRWLLPACGPK